MIQNWPHVLSAEPRVVIAIDAAELVGRNPGELPGPLPEQFASWPPGGPPATDQPPASA